VPLRFESYQRRRRAIADFIVALGKETGFVE